MKNKFVTLKRGIVAILTAALVLSPLPTAMMKRAAEKAEATDATLQNPYIVPDDGMKAGKKVTWDCVYFGSYPQAEVIPSGVEYTALDASLRREGDVIVSDSVHATLQSASSWDENNDIILDGVKYRRMKEEDATAALSDLSTWYNWSGSTDYHYFKYEPIKWRVLCTDGNQALLLSDMALDDQEYHKEYESVTWKTSTVRSWLNGYEAASNKQSVDYRQKNFIDSAFTASEQVAIVNSSLENADNIEYGTNGGSDTTDKIFLLSGSDVWDTDTAKSYGFVKDSETDDETRCCQSSTYAKAMGMWSSIDTAYAGNGSWWLRSPGWGSGDAMCVGSSGWGSNKGFYVYAYDHGIRPALNLNLSSSNLYTYAGTVCSDVADTEADGDTPTPPETETDPEETETPSTDKKPQETETPSNGKQPPSPSRPEEPAVRKGQTVKAGRLRYKVSKVHSDGTGEVILAGAASKKDAKKLTSLKTGDTVKINKKNFKVTAIANNAFKNCKKLKRVVLGKEITSIGAKAFSGCKALKKITIKSAKLKKVGKNAFKGIHAKAVIKAPKAKLKAYKKLLRAGGMGLKARIK